MNASSPTKVVINSPADNRMLTSERLIYTEKQDTIPVVIGKKGNDYKSILLVQLKSAKKSGKTLFRQGTISRRDIFKFGQTVHNKSYTTPLDFVGETRVSKSSIEAYYAKRRNTCKHPVLPPKRKKKIY